jgi:hypothetical protein
MDEIESNFLKRKTPIGARSLRITREIFEQD